MSSKFLIEERTHYPVRDNTESHPPDSDASVRDALSLVPDSHDDLYDNWSSYYSNEPSESARTLRTNAEDNWLICSGDRDKDITVHLDLDAGLDISPDLGHLARLSQLGDFNQANRLYEDRLAPHVDFFPVVAEYADLLLEQENYGHLHKFISNRLADPHAKYLEDEVLLLEVIKSLAGIYTRGALIPALEMATKAFEHLSRDIRRLTPLFQHPTGTQIQLMEACVRIVAHAAAHSNFLESEPFHSLLHWSFPNEEILWQKHKPHDHIYSPQAPKPIYPDVAPTKDNVWRRKYPQVGPWYRLLIKEGFLWESHRLLRAILPLFGCENDGHYVDDRGFEEFAKIDDISKARDEFPQLEDATRGDDQILLTEFANASLLARFLYHESALETVRTAHTQFHEKSYSLASTILSKHPHLIRSRTYLEWALFESTESLSTIWPVNQQRSIGVMSYSDLGRVQSLQRNPSIVGEAGLTQTPSTLQNRNFDTIYASAKELGNYYIEELVLQKLYQYTRDFDQKLQALQALAHLYHDTLQDASGYLRCLIDEFFLLDSGDFTNSEGMRKDLYRRLTEFTGSFPFLFDYNEHLRHDTAIIFFDNPLLKWMERRVSYLLLKSFGRPVEANLARAQLSSVGRHLPKHLSSQLGPAMHHKHTSHNSLADTGIVKIVDARVPHFHTHSAQGNIHHIRRRRAILPQSFRDGTETNDVKENLEKLIYQSRHMRRKREELVKGFLDAEREEGQWLINQRIAELERQERRAENRANPAETATLDVSQQSFILKDPTGREFLFPFDQCRSFEAFLDLLQQVSRHDAILSSHIARNDYELIGPDNKPISSEDWGSVAQPGLIITMHPKPNPWKGLEDGGIITSTLSAAPEHLSSDKSDANSVHSEHSTRKQNLSARVEDTED